MSGLRRNYITTASATASPWTFGFQTRSAFVAAVDLVSMVTKAGQSILADGYSYICAPGSTDIPDLPGWVPDGQATGHHFGARPDDPTFDNTTALNRLGSYVRARARFGQTTAPNSVEDGNVIVWLMPGRYYCDLSVNFAQIRGMGWTLMAHGAEICSKDAGYPAFDLIGSRWGTIVGLKVIGDATTPPRCGFQCGRTSAVDYACDNMYFDHCKTDGHFSLTAFYNLASETDLHTYPQYYNAHPGADSYCLVMDGNNFWGATTRAATAIDKILVGNYTFSNIQHTFLNTDIRKRTSGPAVWASNVSQMKFINSYVNSADSFLFTFADNGSGYRDIDLDVHGEREPTHFVRFQRQSVMAGTYIIVHNMRIRDHGLFVTDAVIKLDDSIQAIGRVEWQGGEIYLPLVKQALTNGMIASADRTRLYLTDVDCHLHASLVKNYFQYGGSLTVDQLSNVVNFPIGRYQTSGRSTHAVYEYGDRRFVSRDGESRTGSTIADNALSIGQGSIGPALRSTAPTAPYEGMIACDDGTNWSGKNPAGAGNGRLAVYRGGAWRALEGIVDSGSNENGTWRKFADGSMECEFIMAAAASGPATWTFPQTFTAAPNFIGHPRSGALPRFVSSSSPLVASVDFWCWTDAGAQSSVNCYLLAKGRWF